MNIKPVKGQTMQKHYVYFYFTDSNNIHIKDIIRKHIEYWKDQKPENYQGGPFSDRSGGMISFTAENFETAQNLALGDPFVTEKVVKKSWLKEWVR